MPRKTSIKIVKRAKREGVSQTIAAPLDKDGGREGVRHVTSTVNGWVREFQLRRRAERRRAFEVLSENRAPLTGAVGESKPAGQ